MKYDAKCGTCRLYRIYHKSSEGSKDGHYIGKSGLRQPIPIIVGRQCMSPGLQVLFRPSRRGT